MKFKTIIPCALWLLSVCTAAGAEEFNPVPSFCKWISSNEAAFSYDGSFTDSAAFSIRVPSFERRDGVKAPGKYESFPFEPSEACNLTWAPDSSRFAYTRGGNLYVMDAVNGEETALTDDGSDLILNGYASWVYYEEIFGRPSNYRAFWWSPDSRKLAFCRFDNTRVPLFPIFSAEGKHDSLSLTRYPKAGDENPAVRVGIIDFSAPDQGSAATDRRVGTLSFRTVWADFDETDDQYFGTPFWSADSRKLYVQHEPRIQNCLDLYAVDASDGSKTLVHSESCMTWLEWLDDMLFTPKGMYVARDFETDFQQIYFLSYDGRTFKKLSGGENRGIRLLRVDEKTGLLYFTARRDCSYRNTLYSLNISDGSIIALTDPSLNAAQVTFSPDGRWFSVQLSGFRTPTQVWIYETARAHSAWANRRQSKLKGRMHHINLPALHSSFKLADAAPDGFRPADYALPEVVWIEAEDGQPMPGAITYPAGFDPSKRYPVRMEIYGGPQNAYVRERWLSPERYRWFSDNGIISITIDTRAAGHSGRRGSDLVFKDLTSVPVTDALTWAKWLAEQPYVDAERIGIEGFSFGGTMTAMLLIRHHDVFRCGIAGGGVYDWSLYDSHYTERFMLRPQDNESGYRSSCVLEAARSGAGDSLPSGALKLTHGTSDDNVHFQNTLQLADVLQRRGVQFDLMIYPGGMHGYRGAQGRHSEIADQEFWTRWLLNR